MELETYCVYMHINKLNGKKYIGVTKQLPEQRWRDGYGYKTSHHFWKSIKLYGWDNFEHLVLYQNLSERMAYNIEKALIALYKTTNENLGYNLSVGGKGNAASPNTQAKAKMSKAKKEKYCGEKNPMYGKTHTPEARKKISEANKKKKPTYKPVICIDTYEWFPSVSDAAKAKNTDRRNISACLHGHQHTAAGLRWRFADAKEYLKPPHRNNGIAHPTQRKPVYCFETKKIYPSIQIASDELNIDSSSVCKVCRGRAKSINGYHFCYASEMEVNR